jgi:hypothetical protein
MVVGVVVLGEAANIFAVDVVGPGVVVQCGLSHVEWYTVGWGVDLRTAGGLLAGGVLTGRLVTISIVAKRVRWDPRIVDRMRGLTV